MVQGVFYLGPPRSHDHAEIVNGGRNTVTLNTNSAPVDGLTVANGNRLTTNGHQLTVNNQSNSGELLLEGGTTRLDVMPVGRRDPAIVADVLRVRDDATMYLQGATVDVMERVYMQQGGTIRGNGTIRLHGMSGGGWDPILENSGSIEVASFEAFGGGNATLRLESMNDTAQIDLHGSGGVVDVDGDVPGQFNQLRLEVAANLDHVFEGATSNWGG